MANGSGRFSRGVDEATHDEPKITHSPNTGRIKNDEELRAVLKLHRKFSVISEHVELCGGGRGNSPPL